MDSLVRPNPTSPSYPELLDLHATWRAPRRRSGPRSPAPWLRRSGPRSPENARYGTCHANLSGHGVLRRRCHARGSRSQTGAAGLLGLGHPAATAAAAPSAQAGGRPARIFLR